MVDHHCHSLRADWTSVLPHGGAEREGRDRPAAPGWRACFTEADAARVLERDVPTLLGYRHFLTALREVLPPWAAAGDATEASPPAERELAAARDRAAAEDGGQAYLRTLLDDAGTSALLVDTGFGGPSSVSVPELRRRSDREVHEIVRLETVAEGVLARGGPGARSLPSFFEAVGTRISAALDEGARGVKSVLAYRGGLGQLRVARPGALACRQAFSMLDRETGARRFEDPVLGPALLWHAAELAAARGVPLQVHTGFGDPDVDLAAADPALLRPLLRDPRTAGCTVVLLHCHPYVRGASYLAGTYPQAYMDLSLTIPLAEPIAAELLREALALCPASKLLAGSDGHSYPEMHWWGARIWDRALHAVLAAEIAAGALDVATARDLACRVLGGNARELYLLPA